MKKRTGKGKALDINGGGTSKTNAWKMLISAASEGLPVREWKPYHESEALRRNIERCKELTALPSRYA